MFEVTEIKEVRVSPINEKSNQLFKLKEHAVVGISPFNSYFKEEKIEKIISWAMGNFNSVNVFIPDMISKFSLQAVGYSLERAIKKTRRQDSYLKNKVIRALNNIGFSDEEAFQNVLFISALNSNESYVELYNQCIDLFEKNPEFRSDCFAASEWVLSGMKKVSLNEHSLKHAVKYFLYELPLFLNTPQILNISSSLFIYHNIPYYIKKIYDDYSIVSSKQGFIAVEISEG